MKEGKEDEGEEVRDVSSVKCKVQPTRERYVDVERLGHETNIRWRFCKQRERGHLISRASTREERSEQIGERRISHD